MAGQLTIDTLKASTGVLATQNGMTGIAKAWVNFQGGNGNTAGVVVNSFNVSSISVGGSGAYSVNLTTPMPTAGYTVVTGFQRSGTNDFVQYIETQSSASIVKLEAFSGGAVANVPYVFVAVFA